MQTLRALTLLLCSASALAGVSPGSATSTEAQIQATLKQRLAALPIETVRPASIPGLYEVITSEEVLYTDSRASVLFIGKLVDTQTREDISARHWNEFHTIDFKALPFEDAIKTVRGDGSRTVAVFADPKCPYCQQLEKNLTGVTNITIYTFLFPLEEVHPGATAAAHAIWCSPDRAAAWSGWMLEHTPPAATSCDSDPLRTLQGLGNKLIVNMTPTVFFADGQRFAGAMSQSEFERHLESAAAADRKVAKR